MRLAVDYTTGKGNAEELRIELTPLKPATKRRRHEDDSNTDFEVTESEAGDSGNEPAEEEINLDELRDRVNAPGKGVLEKVDAGSIRPFKPAAVPTKGNLAPQPACGSTHHH